MDCWVFSNSLMTKVGGAKGPLYGHFGGSLARVVTGKETIDAVTFRGMRKAIVTAVQAISDAKVGE
jgi:hypothetical protein